MNEQVKALIRSVRDDPEARDELLRALLSDRFLDLPARVDAIDATLLQLVQRMHALTERMDALYFAPIALRIKVLSQDTLDDLLEQAQADGTLTRSETLAVRLADTIASGRRDDAPVHLVVESSYTVDERDVERAVDRAQLLGRVVGRTFAIVAGEYIDELAQRRAEEQGVWQALDGTVTAPGDLELLV